MKRSIRVACLFSLLAATGAAPAAGTVQLSWMQPEHFTDIGPGPVDRARHLAVLGQQLQALGRHLPEGRSLVLEVLDVDLAGSVEWLARDAVRVLRDNGDGPRLQLRWRLVEAASTLQSGEAWLSDLALNGTLTRQGGDLPHERQLIERWFQATFVTP